MTLLPPVEKLKALPPAAQKLREQAFEFARSKGLPTKRDEEWRYTSLKPLSEGAFTSSLINETRASHDTLKAVSAELGDWAYNIVFINGILDRTLSSLEDLPSEVQWSTDVEASGFADVMEALSVASIGQGLTLKIKADASLGKPLRIHFHTALEGGPALMVSPRVQIDIGARTTVTLIESYSGQAEARYFVNAHTELTSGTSSQVTYVRWQEESTQAVHIGRTRWKPAGGSELTSLVASAGAALNRHDYNLVLEATEVNAKILGLVAGNGDQHADNATEIDHRVGGCTTQQTYKSLLAGKSRSVFSGRIRIRPNAQKANSDQMNKNLLLSSQAEADSRPQLMIEADDVKATHGSTVGELSDEEIFYLMSRGVTREKAVSLLSAGFLADVVHEIGNEHARTWMLGRLKDILATFKSETT